MPLMKTNPQGESGTAAGGHQPRTGPSSAGRIRRLRFVLGILCALLMMAAAVLVYADLRRDYRHGIYRCADGRMLEEPAVPDSLLIDKTAETIAALHHDHPEISQYMMLVPSASYVQSGYLPQGAEIRNQAADLSSVRAKTSPAAEWIDLLEIFREHNGEKLYYATDIWLTGWGSRYAARAALEAMNAERPAGRDICYLLSDSFRGNLGKEETLLRKLTNSRTERLEIYVPEKEAVYYRVDGTTGEWYGSLYDASALDGSYQYDVFFGGERACTEIHTTAVNGEVLLVFGDRTADSIVPMLVSSFEKIIYVHPEKYTGKLSGLLKKHRPTKILYLYGANSFLRDGMLQRVLAR
ncbi:MAG: DHHW family protein [Eubacteriales bacterium]|nr:DHHW family protein [Eubacteriales bacterium]